MILLYVGGFSFHHSEEELQKLFAEQVSEISFRIQRSADTDESRCYGFLEVPNEAAAEKIIEHFHDQRVLGKILKVEYAQREDTGREHPEAIIW